MGFSVTLDGAGAMRQSGMLIWSLRMRLSFVPVRVPKVSKHQVRLKPETIAAMGGSFVTYQGRTYRVIGDVLAEQNPADYDWPPADEEPTDGRR